MKGIIYTRVSSGEQVEGTSLEFQEEVCKKYCKEKNIEVVKLFREEGESAKDLTLNNRQEFLRALDYCRKNKGKIDTFVVLRVNRFARNTEDHFAVRKILLDYGVSLHSVTEPIDNSPTGKFIETVLAGASEYDNAIRKRQSTDGMITQINRGIYPWKAPLGYKCLHSKKHGEKKTQPDPPDNETFSIVQKGLKEYSKGLHSQMALAKRLDELGLAKIRGKKTTPQLVDRLTGRYLKFYAGIIVNPWTGEEKQGLHKRMITEDEMHLIRFVRSGKTNNTKKQRLNPDFPLRGAVLCSYCGSPLTGSFSKGRKEKYPYYHCHNKECEMYGRTIPKTVLEKEFTSLLGKITPKEDFLALFKQTVIDLWEERGESFDLEAKKYEKHLEILKEKRKRIFEMREEGSYTKEEFTERKEEMENEIVSTKISLSEARIEQFDVESALTYATNYSKNLKRQWIDIPDSLRPRFQKLVFPEGISYKKNEGFGTATLGLIYAINECSDGSKSQLVARRGIEPLFPG